MIDIEAYQRIYDDIIDAPHTELASAAAVLFAALNRVMKEYPDGPTTVPEPLHGFIDDIGNLLSQVRA